MFIINICTKIIKGNIHFPVGLLLPLVLLIQTLSRIKGNDFEPYTLNGGLVSAVAGRDFVLIASDTRLTDGGYEILSRTHLQSRLWSATATATTSNTGSNIHNEEDKSSSVSFLSKDGSVQIPPTSQDSRTTDTSWKRTSLVSSPPTFIASAGCASDCETLKRQLRSELQSHTYWNHGGKSSRVIIESIVTNNDINGMQDIVSIMHPSPSSIANILGQTLYTRRGFPFYSFCILAGLEEIYETDGNSKTGSCVGVVHSYDAIGSHERVAVASAGTGKEMLQPILDRLFATASISPTDKIESTSSLRRDGGAIHASEQRVGLKLQPPVETCVKCTSQEAIALVVRGYRSVAEREISVGDNVVVCLIQKEENNESLSNDDETVDGTRYVVKVLRYPLKKH